MKQQTLVFLAEGFEEIEALSVIDILRRSEVEVVTVAITEERSVRGAHRVPVVADTTLSALGTSIEPQAIVLPGGMPGAQNLAECTPLLELLRKQDQAGRWIAAICAAPIVLAAAGVGTPSTELTCYPGFEGKLSSFKHRPEGTVCSGHFITGQGPAYAMEFGYRIAACLQGDSTAQQVKKDMLYPH